MNDKWKKNLYLFCKGWGLSILVAVLLATSFKSALADWNDVPTGSMTPTILAGDRLLVNKLAYDLKIPYTTLHLAAWADPRRGDIVVFYSPENGIRLVKRVVGLPGDVIAMDQNRLSINGHVLNYAPTALDRSAEDEINQTARHLFFMENLPGREHVVMLSPQRPSLNSFGPVTIPQGKYFMMGDNRDNSADSRYFGLVDRHLILGRATMVVISRDGSFLHPRWDRFFSELS